jgi:hypothetical protein
MKVPAYVRSLAAGLMCAMQIEEGVELVRLIGNGDEYSNQRAVETWLMTHYPDEQLQSIREPLNTLSKALKRHIDNHYNNLEVYSC